MSVIIWFGTGRERERGKEREKEREGRREREREREGGREPIHVHVNLFHAAHTKPL